MESLENLKKQWNTSKTQNELTETDVTQIVKTRVRKEKKILFEYFWASYFWQFIIYVAMTRLIIHFWGDWNTVAACALGILIYIPFTTIFIRKFTAMATKSANSAQSMSVNLKMQWEKLSEFFQFKKRFDWIGIPISCFLLTMIIFKLWVPGGFEMHPIGGTITFVLWIAAFLIATVIENRKRFKEPLYNLELVVKELQDEV